MKKEQETFIQNLTKGEQEKLTLGVEFGETINNRWKK